MANERDMAGVEHAIAIARIGVGCVGHQARSAPSSHSRPGPSALPSPKAVSIVAKAHRRTDEQPTCRRYNAQYRVAVTDWPRSTGSAQASSSGLAYSSLWALSPRLSVRLCGERAADDDLLADEVDVGPVKRHELSAARAGARGHSDHPRVLSVLARASGSLAVVDGGPSRIAVRATCERPPEGLGEASGATEVAFPSRAGST